VAGIAAAAAFLVVSSAAVAQNQTPAAEVPTPAHMAVPDGYTGHHTIEAGGRKTFISGSDAFYNTLVNFHDGPRVFGESFEMRANPGTNPKVDYLKAFGNGFGGDPYVNAKLQTGNSKYFEYTGFFRRSRQYSDYNLLGNPFIAPGKSVPIGPSNAPTSSLPWGPVNQSPVMFNTVRRMLDNDVTVFPLRPVSARFAYSHYTMEGPTLSPSYTIFKYDALLQQYQRNGSDDYTAAVDWKLEPRTTLSLEQHLNHYKMDSYFTLNPNAFKVTEADGTPVDLGNWDSQTPYGISSCNTNSMGSGFTDSTHYTILSPSSSFGGKPIINAACAVVSSYTRTQPTRVTTPTSIVRFQSKRFENVAINGDARYTLGTSKMPSYYEDVRGLNGAVREQTYSGGYAQGHRHVFAADFGIIWEATKSISVADQVNYSSTAQPGYSNIPAPLTLSTPKTAGNQTINFNGPLTPGVGTLPHGINGVLTNGYFGQSWVINNATVSWNAVPSTIVSLNYRFEEHKIGEGVPHKGLVQETDPVSGEVDITGNGGGLNIAYHPANNLSVNASAELFYNDNAFTPWTPRQQVQYRARTVYKPKGWATVTLAYNDRERHNNTNNQEEEIAAGEVKYYGPLKHEDYYRVGSAGLVLAPSEKYTLEANYSYTRNYAATNVCFASGAAAGLPGTATVTASGAPNVCPGIFARGSTTQLVDFHARDFEDVPTNVGIVALTARPTDSVKYRFGYNITSTDGSRFYADARDVSGSLLSKYQTPFASAEWKMTQSLTWKGEYNYYNYNENGPQAAELCSLTVSATATVTPCKAIGFPTGATAPASGYVTDRKFRANNVTVGFHYEF
jgi:hypothetical protein